MKYLFLLTVFFCLYSCSSTKVVTNAPSSYTIQSNKNFEQTWTDVIDYVSRVGTSIRTIDKASGLIITDEYSFTKSYTYETKDGQLQDNSAYVVLNKKKGSFGVTIKPDFITGNFNIRVKPTSNGSSITVNLVNLKAATTVGKNMYGGGGHLEYYTVKSTNVFEKELAKVLND